MTEIALPASYTYGYVFGGVIRAQGDTSLDPDRYPHGMPATGTVIFEPLEKLRRSSEIPPRFVQHEKVVCTLSAKTGLLMDAQSYEYASANPTAPEEYGVWLVTGTYRVSFSLNSGSIEPFNILVTDSHTVSSPLYLSNQAPDEIPAGAAVTVMQVPVGTVGMVLGWTDTGLKWVAGGGGSGGGAADWNFMLNKPTYIGAGATPAAARAAIGAAAEGSTGGGGGGVVILSESELPPNPPAPGVLYVRLVEGQSPVLVPPTVTIHPANVTVQDGSNAVFSSAATGNYVPTIQWQHNIGGTWANIAGATSSPLVIPATLAINGRQYRAVWTNSDGSTTSNVATLTVTSQPVTVPVITTQPSSQTVTEGDPVIFTAAATGADSQQWQVNTGGAWNAIPGATSTSYTIVTTALPQNGYQFRCAFTNGGGTVTTNAATLTVEAVPSNETVIYEDLFNRANGPIASPWVLDAGTAAVIDTNALRVNASGYHRVSPGAFPAGPMRVEGQISGPILRFTGLYLGRSQTDPTTYPGVKVSTSQTELGFSLTSAETVFGSTLDNLSDLTAAVTADVGVGGLLGIEWDGTVMRYYWNGQQVDQTAGATFSALMAPDNWIVGVTGSSATSVLWDEFRVWSL